MNCHGNHGDNGNGQENGHKGHLSHMWMMLLCCGIPVLLLLLVPFLARNGGSGIAKLLTVVAPFICPLMMIFMIPAMFKLGKSKADKNNFDSNNQMQPEKRVPEK